jgi:hypothetical protein
LQPITKEVMERAREALIARRDTHLDALIDRLKEPRVRNILDALLSGTEPRSLSDDDLQYVRDLGLIGLKGIAIANPIYKEIVPRALTYVKQEMITQDIAWYQNPDGSINMIKLMQAFTQFFQENSEIWLERFDYKESGPHLLLMAFLQRVINGGGTLTREYALGRKRVDLLLVWKTQRIVIEMKINYGPKAYQEGLEQTVGYMDTSNATEGHLVIFDQHSKKSWEEKIYHKQESVNGKTINDWGM